MRKPRTNSLVANLLETSNVPGQRKQPEQAEKKRLLHPPWNSSKSIQKNKRKAKGKIKGKGQIGSQSEVRVLNHATPPIELANKPSKMEIEAPRMCHLYFQ